MPRTDKSASVPRTAASADQVERLIEAVEDAAAQLRVLRDVLDEVREDFQYAVRNGKFQSPPAVFHLTSMPVDPLAPDFGARLNCVKPEDLPKSEQPVEPPSPEPPRASLFPEDDGA